jgi:AcrR family transcriptional regulator
MPSARTSRTLPPEIRRTAILDATRKLVSEHGAAELTIEEITSAADIAKGTFYLYFKSKHDVLVALRDRLAAEILADHEAALAALPPDDHTGRLTQWLRLAIESRVRRASLHDALFHSGHAEPAAARGADSHIAMLARLLEEGATAGQFDIADPELVATLLYNAMHGAVQQVLAQPDDKIERLVRAVQDMAVRAVMPLTVDTRRQRGQ